MARWSLGKVAMVAVAVVAALAMSSCVAGQSAKPPAKPASSASSSASSASSCPRPSRLLGSMSTSTVNIDVKGNSRPNFMGNPRFTGGDGNTFYFHGHKDQSFCILSDTNLHINAHFMGNHNPELKRDFTSVQALGITFGGGQRLYIGARKAMKWDEDEDHIVVALDGEPVDVAAVRDARWLSRTLPGLSVTRTDAINSVLVQLDGVFAISANAVPATDEDDRDHLYGRTNKDSLVHLDLGFRFHNLTAEVDGVLGQTYRPSYVSRLDIGAKMPVMGGAHKYLSSGLFSTNCAVSKFQHGGGITAFGSS